jgi:hypothetical protein
MLQAYCSNVARFNTYSLAAAATCMLCEMLPFL